MECTTLEDEIDLQAKVTLLSRKLHELEIRRIHEIQIVGEPIKRMPICTLCQSANHLVSECPRISAAKEIFKEQANAVGNFKQLHNNPYANTYNPGWRNHPNFSWRNNNCEPQYNARNDNVQGPVQSSAIQEVIGGLKDINQ